MNNIKEIVEKAYRKKGRNMDRLTVGSTVRVNTKIKEGAKERIQAFEGIIIAKGGTGLGQMFTVRKISYGGVGVERTFPLHSPLVDSITVKKQGKAKRAKLFYLREAFGRKAKREVKRFDTDMLAPEAPAEAEAVPEAVPATEAAAAAPSTPEDAAPATETAPAKEEK